MQAVLDFFEERRGRFHSFLWRDGLDHSSNGPQPLGTGDGAEMVFQIVKRYGTHFDRICGRYQAGGGDCRGVCRWRADAGVGRR